jgi:hypothetical protein
MKLYVESCIEMCKVQRDSCVNSFTINICVLNVMQSLPWHIRHTVSMKSDFRLTMRCGGGKERNRFTNSCT